ncbi:hypothetical protein B4U79_12907 [Dinothrombium tinctorium]|uniref:Methionine--tRNA ligase, cytoplasmic n=1 Tax=Dinothrombium tinctorium TaxID=1965070 RepID=A0A3S3Q7Q2_9ACAR|nr:hypothetical protein B4U79_08538 [Dinothrombium tinctorium]RWS05078.1 hypothetical protein B4U79_12907 [Dinothrombium tinctorium]
MAESNCDQVFESEEIERALQIWHSSPAPCSPLASSASNDDKLPLLPVSGKRNVLITSALPYVNNVPHLGNIIGSVLSADVFARYCRLRGYNAIYMCGTDEYGTATETKALEDGITPEELCEKYHKVHSEVYKWFNISFDKFGRTSTPEQTEITQKLFWQVYNNGYCFEDSVEQLFCQNCQRFLADRYVEGTCPLCGYDDARGDQCDKCNKLVNSTELKHPRCKLCKVQNSEQQTTIIIKPSKHIFLDLPKIEAKLKEWFQRTTESSSCCWTQTAKAISNAWLKEGLNARCISRDLKWGTPVPLEGFTDKVFYVWFDAPIGYFSITANYTKDWEKWWKNPEQVELFQFMAKDNVPFHGIVFPATLLAANDKYTIVNHLSGVEYLNYEDTKFSKSRGVGIFGNDAKDTDIPSDIWRFYLLFIRPETQDSSFSWDDLMVKNNSELLNNLGNFVNRALLFIKNNFDGVVPKIDLKDDDKHLITLINREVKTYIELLEKVKLRDAIKPILNIGRLGNQHIQACKPWLLIKGTDEEKSRSASVMALCANISALLSILLQPYTPDTCVNLQNQLNICQTTLDTEGLRQYLKEGHRLGTPTPLFKKLEQKKIDELKKRYAGASEKKQDVKPTKPIDEKCTVEELSKMIDEQGDKIRKLKLSGAEKSVVTAAVQILNDYKHRRAALTGEPVQVSGQRKSKK